MFLVVSLLTHLRSTMFADTLIIMVYLLDGVTLHDSLFDLGVVGHGRYVINAATPLAEEMAVRLGNGVVAGVALVDGEGGGCTVIAQELERIIYRGLRQGGYAMNQGLIDFIHRGVGVMFHQVAHDGNALKRRLNVVLLQASDDIHD